MSSSDDTALLAELEKIFSEPPRLRAPQLQYRMTIDDYLIEIKNRECMLDWHNRGIRRLNKYKLRNVYESLYICHCALIELLSSCKICGETLPAGTHDPMCGDCHFNHNV